MPTIDTVAPSVWDRAKANVAAFFSKPTRLPLIVLLGMLVVGIPKLVAPAIGDRFKIGLDLQDAKCLPYTLYAFKMGGTDGRVPESMRITPTRGMLVSFIPRNNAMGNPALDGQRIVKIVAGLPGDSLEVRDDVAYVNGKEWGRLWLLDALGKTSGSLDRRTVVPPGKVLLMGTLNESYDGRYYGFIDQSEIVAQAFALF